MENESLPIKLSNLPLKPCTLSSFQRRGFMTTRDVSDAKKGGIRSLAEELEVSLQDAIALSREVEGAYRSVLGENHSEYTSHSTSTVMSVSAADILRSHREDRPIVTFCEQIDGMLGGGVAIGEVTEFCGEPGVGKTQMGMQIAVDARLPVDFGGVAGEAIYIDTEGSFAPERCWSMAKALVAHVHSCSRKRAGSILPSWFNAEDILDGIHVFRCHDEAAQTATILSLPTFIKEHEKLGKSIKVLIIDSIAFHFRSSEDYKSRTRTLISTAAFLSDLATNFRLAVVVMNQMTTKFGSSNLENTKSTFDTQLIPALGESWSHATTTRLLLSLTAVGARECHLIKSPHKPAGVALYSVSADGIRDYCPINKSEASKRPRVQL